MMLSDVEEGDNLILARLAPVATLARSLFAAQYFYRSCL